jgi:hypothetical protein
MHTISTNMKPKVFNQLLKKIENKYLKFKTKEINHATIEYLDLPPVILKNSKELQD